MFPCGGGPHGCRSLLWRARANLVTPKVKKPVREPKASTKGDQHFSDILSRPIRQVLRWIGSQVRACSLIRPVTSREQFTPWLGTPRVTPNATVPCSTWLLMLPRAHST